MVGLLRACCWGRYSLKTGSILCASACALISFIGFMVAWRVVDATDKNDDRPEAYVVMNLYITMCCVYALLTLFCLLLVLGAKKENEMFVVYWVIAYAVLTAIYLILVLCASVMQFTGIKHRFWKALGTLLVGIGSVAVYGFSILVAFSFYRSLLNGEC